MQQAARDRATCAERAAPAGKVIHAILDNYAAHKRPAVMKRLAGQPRRTFRFTPISASWLNAVKGFFSTIPRRKIRRGAFRAVPEREAELARDIDARNKSAKSFVWTKPAKGIFDKIAEIPEPCVRVSALARSAGPTCRTCSTMWRRILRIAAPSAEGTGANAS